MKAASPAVPNGYKRTDLGVIPLDWELKQIGDIAAVFSGGTPNREAAEYWGGDIPWITTALIAGGEIAQANEFITATGLEGSSAKWCRAGTILMAMYGQGKTRGKVGILSIDATINQACAAIELRGSISSEFVLHVLNYMYEDIRELSNSGGQENLSGALIKKIRIPYPTEPEQRAIATALSDVDALLEELDRLIAKKRDIKQATMQRLLTGQTRLPGFEGEWESRQLSEYCLLKSGEAITSSRINSHAQYRCYGGHGLRGYTTSFTHDGEFALIGRQGALCGNVIQTSGKFFASEHALVVTPNSKTDISWLAIVLERMNLNQYSESSAQPGLSARKLLMLQVFGPTSKSEQSAIAQIITEMDSEIEILEKRRSKTSDLKEAMMQELLTGRTRLV